MKKIYVKPKLIRHGKLEEKTQSSTGTPTDGVNCS